jgi:hypothetical protein
VLHPQLGQLVLDNESVRGEISYRDQRIPLNIEPDDRTLDEALAFAAIITASLPEYDRISKDVAAADLLESYNTGWNEYDEVQDDGSLKAVLNPKLTPGEFKDRLSLTAVNVTSDCCVALWYNDHGLFWGHSVFVESLDGPDFTNAKAQLFG